jgi:hypothetical protein
MAIEGQTVHSDEFEVVVVRVLVFGWWTLEAFDLYTVGQITKRLETDAGIWVRLRMSPLVLKAALSDAVFGDEALTTALAQLRCLVALST